MVQGDGAISFVHQDAYAGRSADLDETGRVRLAFLQDFPDGDAPLDFVDAGEAAITGNAQ